MKERKGKQSVSRDSQPFTRLTPQRKTSGMRKRKSEMERRDGRRIAFVVSLSLKAETIVVVALPGH